MEEICQRVENLPQAATSPVLIPALTQCGLTCSDRLFPGNFGSETPTWFQVQNELKRPGWVAPTSSTQNLTFCFVGGRIRIGEIRGDMLPTGFYVLGRLPLV